MNTSRIFLFILAAIAGIVIMTALLRLTARIFRRVPEAPYKETPAFAAWFAGTVVMLATAFIPAMNAVMETSDLVYGTAAGNSPVEVKQAFTTVLKTTGILLLLAAVWFWIWQIVCDYLVIPVWGKTSTVTEMELGSMNYFVVRGLLSVLCMLIVNPFYLSLLHYFIPDIAIPFYR